MTTMRDLAGAPPTRLDIPVIRALRAGAELRAADGEGDAGIGTMGGHFSVFNEWYEIDSYFEGRFLERIAPGAFKRTFNAYWSATDSHRIQVLLDHGYDPTVGDKLLGVPEVLEEDDRGAHYEVPLFDTSYNRDLLPALDSGAYGASFRFRAIQDRWNDEPGVSDHNPAGLPERTITEMRVSEFGPTAFPASPGADAALRSLTDRYYERLRARSPEGFDDALRRVHDLRTPPSGGPAATTEDPPRHSEVTPGARLQAKRRQRLQARGLELITTE